MQIQWIPGKKAPDRIRVILEKGLQDEIRGMKCLIHWEFTAEELLKKGTPPDPDMEEGWRQMGEEIRKLPAGSWAFRQQPVVAREGDFERDVILICLWCRMIRTSDPTQHLRPLQLPAPQALLGLDP